MAYGIGCLELSQCDAYEVGLSSSLLLFTLRSAPLVVMSHCLDISQCCCKAVDMVVKGHQQIDSDAPNSILLLFDVAVPMQDGRAELEPVH